MQIDLKGIKRNRMLKQRELLWRAERQAAADVIKLLDEDIGYLTAMNVVGNYFCATFLLWGEDNLCAVNHAFNEEKGLKIWGDAKPELATVETWFSRGRKWAVEETSEFFRLFVAVMESLEKHHVERVPFLGINSKNYQFDDANKERYSSIYDLGDLGVAYIMGDMIAVKKKGIKIQNGSASIVDVGDKPAADVVQLFEKKRERSTTVSSKGPRSRDTLGIILDRIKSLKAEGAEVIANQRRITRILTNSSGGTNIHSIKPDSLLGTIEWIFGLPGGADTSGTTAEILGISKFLKDALPVDELEDMTDGVPLYLGPVLAMIKNGHHTLIESATAIYIGESEVLKKERSINYTPGIYSSLLDATEVSNAEVGSLLKKVHAALKNNEVSEDAEICLYSPTKDSWNNNQKNIVSLRGGTIMKDYEYIVIDGEKLRKVKIGPLLNEACKAVTNPNNDTLEKQMKAIFDSIKSTVTS